MLKVAKRKNMCYNLNNLNSNVKIECLAKALNNHIKGFLCKLNLFKK